jgi:hypothetical protein
VVYGVIVGAGKSLGYVFESQYPGHGVMPFLLLPPGWLPGFGPLGSGPPPFSA